MLFALGLGLGAFGMALVGAGAVGLVGMLLFETARVCIPDLKIVALLFLGSLALLGWIWGRLWSHVKLPMERGTAIGMLLMAALLAAPSLDGFGSGLVPRRALCGYQNGNAFTSTCLAPWTVGLLLGLSRAWRRPAAILLQEEQPQS